MGGLVCRSWSGRTPRDVWEADKVRAEDSVNVVDCVIDGSMQDGEAASRMNSGRVGTSSANDGQKSPVPLNNWVARMSRRSSWITFIVCRGIRGGDPGRQTG